MSTCSVSRCSRRLICPPGVTRILPIQNTYKDIPNSSQSDSRSIRSRSALCPRLDARSCLVSRSVAPLEMISSNQAIATASFLGPLRFNYQIAFAPLSQLFYMFAAPDEWGCVIHSPYTLRS